MSTTIDERVVEMRFDNRNFENNVQTSMSTIDKLRQKLNLTGASDGLSEISRAANKISFEGLSSSIDAINSKFSTMSVIATTALVNITNSAVNAGKKISSALTIDPIKTGFQEYETQINAVQTILANTESKGTTLDDVNKALDELNTYADKTIYNFTQMTRNIGTFTAAGVDLDTSVSAIQGIANLAAVSGSTSQQASTAMYQLSQALAAGRVSLMDWNSVVNAGMGGEVFQNALKRTSEVLGTGAEAAIKKYGSFRESLTQGKWLTTEVLTKTLEQFTMAAEEGSKEWENYKKSLMEEGYTEKQAEEILKMANTATDAATKVKTFTQLWEVLKESAQSGWTQTWEILIGDFEEAKSLLTSVSNVLTDLLNKSAESRNNLLQGWKDLGGRTDLLAGFKNIFVGITEVIKPISKALKAIFPGTTAKQLHNFTAGFKELTESFKVSESTADKLERTFKGLFSIVDLFRKVLLAVAKGVSALFTSGAVSSLLDLILSLTAVIGDAFTVINEGFSGKGLTSIFTGIAGIISGVLHGLTGVSDELSGVAKVVADVIGVIVQAFKTGFGWIADNISFGDVLAGLTGSGIFMAGRNLGKLFDTFGSVAEKGLMGLIFGTSGNTKQKAMSMANLVKDVLGSVSESLGAFTNGIKVASLGAIAVAVMILSSALRTISEIKADDITKSLMAIGVMIWLLTSSFKSITDVVEDFGSKGIVKAGITMMAMAKAIDILADAMVEMSKLSLKQIAKGLIGIGGGVRALASGLKSINGVQIKVTTILAIGALASAIRTIGESLVELGEMSWEGVGRGLAAMGGALVEFMVTLKIMSKIGGLKTLAGSVALVIAAQSLDEIADALISLSDLSWPKIGKSLGAMGGALVEMAAVIAVLGKFSGFSGILGSTSILIAAQSLEDIASALVDLSVISWPEIGRSLGAMGGALTELAVISGVLGKTTGFSGILGASALVIGAHSLVDIANAFTKFTGLDWDTIKMGLVGMGGALTEIGLISGALGKITGFSGILGSGAILIAVQGLGDIADALKKFGSMTWDAIWRGLTGMGLALTEVGVVSGLLGGLTGFAGILGSGAILIAVQGLGDIADALKKFGEMQWEEIGRGLTAMGSALTEIAIGGLLNTLSIIGSISISNIAEPLGVLADSVKKWVGVEVPKGIGLKLTALAIGVTSFTMAGFGASAISEVAAPLGVMADSVKKWKDVTVPENIGTNLKALSKGIQTFTLAGFGASSVAEVATPLGTMADSVKKWVGVTVPENLNNQLSGLADGVKAFSFAFVGGWSLLAIVKPLGNLADSVKKWKDVSVPESLQDQLSNLADGVGAFSFAFMGGWSLSAITKPLGELASSVKKWKDVSIPESTSKDLKSLAEGVKKFDGLDCAIAAKSLGSVATAIKKLSGIDLGTIASGVDKFTKSIKNFGDSGSSISGMGKKITENIVKPINDSTSKFKKAGSKIIDSLSKGITSNNAAKTAAGKAATTISKEFSSKTSSFKKTGAKIGSELAKGIKSKNETIKSASTSGVKAGVKDVKGYYDKFYSAGEYIAKGLSEGMKSRKKEIQAAADDMAAAAEKAVRAKLQINSPSKLFMKIASCIPEGFAKGITTLKDKIKSATGSMTDTATDGTKKALSGLASIIDSGIDAQPTIRPVVDLSEVESSARSISGMFNSSTFRVGADLNAISSSMNSLNQNGNSDIVSAINKLRKDLGNTGNTTYSINGITYDDGSNIASAIQTLARAALVEGRV